MVRATRPRIVLVFVVSCRWPVGGLPVPRQSHQIVASDEPQNLATIGPRSHFSWSNAQAVSTGPGDECKKFAILLLACNPAITFNTFAPRSRLPMGKPISCSSKPHSKLSRSSAATTMKLSIDNMPWKVKYGQQFVPVEIPYGIQEGSPPVPFKVTEEQWQTLEKDGVLLIKDFFTPEWIQYLRNTIDWQLQHPHIASVPFSWSGLYDYMHRAVWVTNDAFANFLYYSPLASALAGLCKAKELRISEMMLIVNPNKGYAWHQDSQGNGPIAWHQKNAALRWWFSVDDCPPDHGAPVFLKGSHKNTVVPKEAVTVDLEQDGLLQYSKVLNAQLKAGDLLVWHPRCIHKIDGPKTGDWGKRIRRGMTGTVAIDDAKYNPSGTLISDLGSHSLRRGDPLQHALFPKIYPVSDSAERAERAAGLHTITLQGILRLYIQSNIDSFQKLLNAVRER